MKILHILDSNTFAGVENVIVTIIAYFCRHDIAESVYLSPRGDIEEKLKKYGVDYYGVDVLSKDTLKTAIDILKPDIIHTHDYKSAVLASKIKCNAKLIIHMHQNPNYLKRLCHSSISLFLACRKACKVLTVTDEIEEDFIFSKFIEDKIYNIGEPINVSRIRRLSNESFSYEGMSDLNEKYIFDTIFVGRLSDEKNPILLADIINSLCLEMPNIRIAVVGDGDARDKLFARIEDYFLEKNVLYFGSIDNPYPLIKKSKSFIIPSREEGYGIAAAEAMILRVPVVCSGTGGLAKFVNDKCGKVCGFVKDSYVAEVYRLAIDDIYHFKKVKATEKRSIYLDNIKEYYHYITNVYDKIKLEEVLWYMKNNVAK
ncbi:glycosyltransferase [Lachnobacterium bovis]|uniref:Glycosyltransferase involved in cell wall bisynthesis n=1 Tax=Lachnobacterium bovis DSM 14045 TaxID=1122142 RepID=A0A1H3JSD4_9FIRM|nr:glycosyltransferase [Lachnobacterium bovis]MBQ1802079.1 glycosyltransferase [Lachnobacterium sp.]SDY42278.1 Glycosyltransferase involved in cell wall bisynthesis [Lachnobacterium bovis DSM 14045]